MTTIRTLGPLCVAAWNLFLISPLAAGDQITLEVRETAGIRRFGYPVAAELKFDPPIAAATRFRLMLEGKPVVAQFRPIKHAGEKIAAVALDFDSNFMPRESREYVVEFGPDVTPVPEPNSGMKVDETADAFLVSHGPNLEWTIPKDLLGLIRSVKTPKWDYMRPESMGLFIRDKNDIHSHVGGSRPFGLPVTARVVKQGPIDCMIRFETWVHSDGKNERCIIEMDFPRSKSWVRVKWTVDDSSGFVADLGVDLNLNVADEPALVDFGASTLVYATLGIGQSTRLEAGPRPPVGNAAKFPHGPFWQVLRGPAGKLEPYVLCPIPSTQPAQGWAHVMDRERCTAVALAEFAQHSFDRIEVAADGRLHLRRAFDAKARELRVEQKSLTFWLHFVGMPPHVGAVTSPQSMQSPLEVEVKAESREQRVERQNCGGAPAGAGDAAFEREVDELKERCEKALAKTSGELRLAGLKERVEVLRDKWGVPHIYAQNRDDLFFAQGFVQAQDRLWQMEIWRRTTEGRLAEIVGPDAVERDRLARLVRYRGDMEAEWMSYSPDARPIIEAFVRGVNAFIEISRDNPPIEFQLTGIKPEPWTPDVCLGRMAGFIMCRNAGNEVLRAELIRELGPDLAAKLLPFDPPHALTVPDGLDLADIDQRIGRVLNAATSAIKIPLADPSRPSPPTPLPRSGERGETTIADSTRLAFDTPLSALDFPDIGSNNWTIAGRLTTTGKPILANDPHRPIPLPSLRYLVHLHCPPAGSDRGWNVIGGTEPSLPGVAIGHNDRVAWGMTIVGTDQMDLYVEDTHPDDPDRYRAGDEWLPMRIEREQIRVRGEPEPRGIELKFTRHGPIIFEDAQRRRAFALRWVGEQPGTAGYLGALALDRVQNWDEFLVAAERWKLPSENLVYADVDGHIGWIAAALTPVRRGWDGLVPAPGASGNCEWEPFLRTRDLPQRFDPPEGFIATANHNILPPGYRHMISYEWSTPFRFGRINEVFREQFQRGHRFAIEDSERLQHDATSLPARRLVALLREALNGRSPLRDGAELLLDWNGVLSSDSAAAAIYEVWQAKLSERVIKSRVPKELAGRIASRVPLAAVLEILGDADATFGPDPILGRDALLFDSLRESVVELQKRLGDDPRAWNWGKLHQAHFKHMLAPAETVESRERRVEGRQDQTAERSAIAEVFNLPSVPRAGDAHTPLAAGGPAPGNFAQTTGASFREIIDLADWDRSVVTSVPGQSGQPGSPHYADLLSLWANGKYFPLLFSRPAVEAASPQRLVLVPVH